MFIALRRASVSVSDFARSRRFYGEVLGLPETASFENDWAEFGLGPMILEVVPLRQGEVPSRNQVAIVLSTNTIDQTVTELKERGVTVTRPVVEEFFGKSAEILDPDGYRIVLWESHELHPDEEWVPMSRIDEIVREKIAAKRAKEREKEKKAAEAAKPAPAKATRKAEPKGAPAKAKAGKAGEPRKGSKAKKAVGPKPKKNKKAGKKASKKAEKKSKAGKKGKK